MTKDSLLTSHAISTPISDPDDIPQFFDSISYDKVSIQHCMISNLQTRTILLSSIFLPMASYDGIGSKNAGQDRKDRYQLYIKISSKSQENWYSEVTKANCCYICTIQIYQTSRKVGRSGNRLRCILHRSLPNADHFDFKAPGIRLILKF